MPIFANRHCLFVVSDRGEVSSYLTNLGFRIQIMKLIISDGGEGDIGIFYTSRYRAVRTLEIHFCHKMTKQIENNNKKKCNKMQK